MSVSLAAVFGAGTLTLATPCVLPMLPVYFSLLLGAGAQAATDPNARLRLLRSVALFVSGFSLVFTLLGWGASSLARSVQEHRETLVVVGGLLILVFGLKYLGVLRIRALDRTWQVRGLSTGRGGLDALLFGAVFALGWTPCVGPVLGSVLTYTATATADPAVGALYLFTYSLGIGLPLLAVSLFADRALPLLRKAHRHLPRMEKASGALMVGAALVVLAPSAARAGATWSSGPDNHARSETGALTPPLGSPTERPRLVEFSAAGCPVCERMKPKMAQLRSDCVGQRVDVLTVDLSDARNGRLASQFQVRGVPTIVLVDETGSTVGHLYGERDLTELRAAAASMLKTSCAGVRGDLPPGAPEVRPTCETVRSERTTSESTDPGEEAVAQCSENL